MHLVFCVEELLHNIFGHCDDPSLAKLARTCRTFKDPALDALWNCLTGLTPLVRCLPKSSWVNSGGMYSFKRHLRESDWRTILGYTCRVRVLRLIEGSPNLALKSVKELSRPPPSTTIFPKLYDVQLLHSLRKIVPFIRHLANPELRLLLLTRPSLTSDLKDVAHTFGEDCPNVKEFFFFAGVPYYLAQNCIAPVSEVLCRWAKLTYVNCSAINLTIEALSHLSRCHLRHLAFFCDSAVNSMQAGSPTLSFLALRDLILSSRSLTAVGKFFDHILCPGLEVLHVDVYSRPTMPGFESFFVALSGACGYDSLKTFKFQVIGCLGDDENKGDREDWEEDEDNSEDEDEDEDEDDDSEDDEWEDEEDEEDESSDTSFVRTPFSITLHCISPLTAFGNIQSVTFDTPFGVDLNEQQMLVLASSWPRLESFCVGDSCESGTITPGGFLQLLERCRSLQQLDIRLDTSDYKEIPHGHPWRGLTMPEGASISLLHSLIDEESVEALTVFFHVAPFPNVCLETHWDDDCSGPRQVYDFMGNRHPMNARTPAQYSRQWSKVFSLARNMWEERRALRLSLETQHSQQEI